MASEPRVTLRSSHDPDRSRKARRAPCAHSSLDVHECFRISPRRLVRPQNYQERYSARFSNLKHQEIIFVCSIVNGIRNGSPCGIGSSQWRLPWFGSSQVPPQSAELSAWALELTPGGGAW